MNSQKKTKQNKTKQQGQTPAILTEQAWSIKVSLVYDFQGNFSFGTQWVVPSRQDIYVSGTDELNPTVIGYLSRKGGIILLTRGYPLCPN